MARATWRALGSVLLLLALVPESSAHALVEERFTTRDGLPSDFVKFAEKDRFGFLWLATDAGLVRYDGVDFTSYEDRLSFPFAKGLLRTRDGSLLAVGDAGVVDIGGSPADVRFTRLFAASPHAEPRELESPKALYEDRRGRIWVSEPRSLARIDGDRLVRYELPPETQSASFLRSYSLAEDGFGTLWAAAQTGHLFRLDVEADRFVPVEIDWPVTVLHQLRPVDDDRFWAATARGLREIRVSEEGEVLEIASIEGTSHVSFIGFTGGAIVLGTYDLDAFIGQVEHGGFEFWTRIHAYVVQHILEEDDGSLWLSTDEGLVHLLLAPFDRVALDDHEIGRTLVSFAQTGDGTLYACNRTTVFRLRVHGSGVDIEPILDDPSLFFLEVLTDDRTVWASHERGMLEIEGSSLVRRIAIDGFYALDIEKDEDARLWMIRANDDGVLRLDPDGTRREYGVDDGVRVRALALDRSTEGELFVVTNDPGAMLLRYDPGRDSFATVPLELAFSPGDAFNVYDLAVEGGGRFWAPSTAGLLQVADGRARPVPLGATGISPSAHAVALADDGLVWMANGLGLVRLDPSTGEHDLFADDSGLPSKMVGIRELFTGPGGGVTAVTARGPATLVAPDQIRHPVPEPALVGVSVGERPADAGAGPIEVPHGGYLAAHFASPYYGGILGYQMRLRGKDEAWRQPQERHEFVVAGLEGGPYTLEVRAVVPGSDRASPPAAIPFTVARPWYRTWWGLLLALAVLGAVAWMATTVMSRRSLRTERRLRALVDERTDELTRANRLLAERNAEMERFLYTVSHDLKSPLISISGFMGLLEQDLQRGELSGAGDFVRRVKASAARMATLLDELLEMSRVGRVKEEPEPVESGALASEVLEEMSARFAERGVAVSVAPGMPTVFADRSRLRQVLQNLLDNSLKFLGDQDEPRVEMGGHAENGRARLFVRDNGLGIDPAHHEAVFELFRRLHRESEGTGVGLSLVKRIVEVHGGRVWIESEGQPGRGTTVWLELPREPED